MIEIERTRSALNHLNPSCDRETWVRIGMSAKSAGLNFEDFHNWSQDGQNYSGENSCRTAWKSFDDSGSITGATLFRMARDKGWCFPSKMLTGALKSQSDPSHHRNEKTSHKPRKEVASASATDVWSRCVPAPSSHDYILRKQGKPDGLRVYPITEPQLIICGQNVAGYLVLPCLHNGEPRTLQFIPPHEGKKLNLPRASFDDGFFIVGEITNTTYVCEGIGQAWAVNNALGAAAVVCFGAGRMMTVAKIIRSQYPTTRLVIVPDSGKEKEAAEIASAIDGQWIELTNDKPKNYDVNDFAQEFGADELASLLRLVNTPKLRFRLFSGADLINAAPMSWLVRGVVPAEGLASLYGASGSGKSFLILDMACAVATGVENWFGHRVSQAPVTYVGLEGEAGMGKRIKAWSLYHNKSIPDALRFSIQPFNLLTDDVSELAKSITAAQGAGGLVIIDTLNRAAPGADENSSVDMGNIIAAAKKLQNLIGGLVLLVHHTGKDTTKGLRGHSSLYAALDGAIEVIKTGARLEWSVAKSKDDITGDAHSFKLEIIQVGSDNEGETITSCVAIQDKSVKSEIRRILPPKSGNQKIVWEALTAELRASNHYGQAGAPIDRPCIRFEEAVEKIRGRLPCEQRRQSERTQSAIGGLITRGLIEHRDGWIWVV